MSRNIQQQIMAVLMVFLLLGPTSMTLFHDHDSENHIEQCTSQGEQHLHDSAAISSCFICAFSLSNFQADDLIDLAIQDLPQLLIRPAVIYRDFFPLFISSDHSPRGPPVFLPVIG